MTTEKKPRKLTNLTREEVKNLLDRIEVLEEMNKKLKDIATSTPESYDRWVREVKYHPSIKCKCSDCEAITDLQGR